MSVFNIDNYITASYFCTSTMKIGGVLILINKNHKFRILNISTAACTAGCHNFWNAASPDGNMSCTSTPSYLCLHVSVTIEVRFLMLLLVHILSSVANASLTDT